MQWTLLEGVNDTEEEIDGLVRLLRGKRAVLNLIPFNSVPGVEFRRPAWEHAVWMARTLHQRGVLTKLRRSNGQDVDGACGQLRRQAKSQESQELKVKSQEPEKVSGSRLSTLDS